MLTQVDLAREVPVDPQTIHRAETRPVSKMTENTAVGIFRALNKQELMPAADIQAFIAGSGIERRVWDVEIERLNKPPSVPTPPSSPQTRTDQARSACITEVIAITNHHDPAQLLPMLRALRELLQSSRSEPHASIPREPFIETTEQRPFPGGIEERKVIKTAASQKPREIRRDAI